MSPPSEPSLFPAHRWLLALLLTGAAALRLVGIAEPALEFAPVRQYRSALIARGLDWKDAEDPTRAAVGAACLAGNRQLEPPVMETLAAVGWGALGEQPLAWPRSLSIAFWLAGALALARLATRLVSRDAGLVAAAFFLLAPFGIAAGRSFQPDPLMTAATLAALVALERLGREPTVRSAALVAASAGLALFVKPVALPLLAFGGAALLLRARPLGDLVRRRAVWAAAALALLPTAVYYLWGIFGAGFLGQQASQTFSPELWLEARFWSGWGRLATSVVAPGWLAAAALGVLLAPRGARRVLLALWAGYAAQSLAFSHHAYTHDYYHLALLPLVGLSLGAAVPRLARPLAARWPQAAPALGFVLLAVFDALLLAGDTGARARRDGTPDLAAAHGIGAVVGPSTEVVALAPDLAKPLQFHGGFVARSWPWSRVIEGWRRRGLPDRTIPEHLLELTGGEWPDWFAVAQLRELGRQPQLAAFLADYPLAGEGPGWKVIDLRGGPPE